MLMSKNGGTFPDACSGSYLFNRRGGIRLGDNGLPQDAAMELALESGGEDMVEDGDEWVIYTAVDQLFAVGASLQAKNVSPKSQRLIYQPSTTVTLSDEATARSFLKLYDALEDYDDTQNVHANFEIADEIAEKLA